MNGFLLTLALPFVAQVERVDVALRLRSFEAAYTALPRDVPSTIRVDIETGFDGACSLAAMLQFSDAITELDRLTARIRKYPKWDEDPAVDPTRPSLIATSCPPVVWPAHASPLRIRLAPASEFHGEDDLALSLTLELRRAETSGLAARTDDALVATIDAVLNLRSYSRSSAEFELPQDHWPKQPGRYVLVERDSRSELASIQFVAQDPDASASTLRARLAAVSERPGLSDEMKRAIAICEDRCSKLRSTWNGLDTFVLVEDLTAHAENLEREVTSIESGVDPYERVAGEMWRALRLDHGKQVLYRVAAPSDVKSIAKLPVIVALHANGGDENMFFHAYGSGELRRLVESKHFLAVTPSTLGLARHPERILSLLDELRHDYPIDRTQIYLLGHSFGSDVAASTVYRFPPAFTAVVEFCNSSLWSDRARPTLVFTGRNDTLRNSSLLASSMSGLDIRPRSTVQLIPIQHRPLRDRGHTLMVGDHLEEAVDFLFAHPRSPK